MWKVISSVRNKMNPYVREHVCALARLCVCSELRVANSTDRTNMHLCCVTRKYGLDPLRSRKSWWSRHETFMS